MPDMSAMSHRPPSLEVTPIVVDGTMYVITPTGIIAALDPAAGAERWRYDAGVNPHRGYGDFASRGVSFWRDSHAAAGALCARRIIAATIDARLIALDAATGKLCSSFGAGGSVDLRKRLRAPPDEFQFYEVTSPPAIVCSFQRRVPHRITSAGCGWVKTATPVRSSRCAPPRGRSCGIFRLFTTTSGTSTTLRRPRSLP